MDEATRVLEACRKRGVTLFEKGGKLAFKPKARMTPGLMYRARQEKEGILALLAQGPPADGFGDFAVDLWRKAIRHAAKLDAKGRSVDTDRLTDEGMEHLWGDREAYRAEARRRLAAAISGAA